MVKIQLTYFRCFQEDFSYDQPGSAECCWCSQVVASQDSQMAPGTLVWLGSDLKESQLDTGMGQEWNHLRVPSKSGWCFGTVSIFPFSREFHFIPTDLFIFLRGVGIPQPTRNPWQIDRSSDLLVACGPLAEPRFCRVWLASFSV